MDFEKQLELIKSDFRKCSKLLLAIGDETRQSIILSLLEAECEGMRVGEITQRTHLSRPSVSYHLRILLEADIVDVRHEGTMNFYSCNLGSEFQQLFDLAHHMEAFRDAVDETFGDRNCFERE